MGKGSKKKTPPDKPDWKKLEEIVAGIQKQLAPNAIVKHDEWVTGKSGATRKLDVSIRQNIGAVSIHIIIDCKRHKRAVERGKVASFQEQIEDVGANQGIMISDSGFDSGAKYVAAKHNILLRNYRKPEETDWNELVGKNSWITTHQPEFQIMNVFVNLENNPITFQMSKDTLIFNSKKLSYKPIDTEYFTAEHLFEDAWNKTPRPRLIGKIDLEAEPQDEPAFICLEGKYYKIIKFRFLVHMRIRRFVVNLGIAEGKIIEDSETSAPDYVEITSEGLKLSEIHTTQTGTLITQEEWNEAEANTITNFTADKSSIFKLRVIGKKKEKPSQF